MSIERYLRAARDAGCPEDQIRNLLRAGIVLQPKQLEASAAARLCDEPGGPTQLGFGGARGGGKSHWGMAQVGADDAQRCPGLKILVLRKVGKSLKEGFEDLLRRMFGSLEYRYVPSQHLVEFANGSRILLGHFQKESDIDAYLGLEYDVILVEEATTLSASKIKAIRTCLRTSKPNWRPRMYYTTNPGNIGHAWFKALFITPYQAKREVDTRFIPATVEDNAFVNAEYFDTLNSLTGWQLRAWRDGDWDIAAGQFFTTFRRDVHVIKPFAIPANWRCWSSLDYGFTHYTAAYLLAEGDGTIYVIAEHAARQTLVPQHVKDITAMLGRWNIPISRLSTFVAGADVFAKRHDGATIAAEYKKLGITLKPANDDRINGAGEILSRLGDVDRGIAPRLKIFETCPRLIETLPLLQHDPHRAEDVLKWDTDEDGIGGDDFYDGARYGVMAGTRKRLQSSKLDLHAAAPTLTVAPGAARTDDEIARLLMDADG